MITFEEQQQKENKIVSDFREMLGQRRTTLAGKEKQNEDEEGEQSP
jgi:hypothetical protein